MRYVCANCVVTCSIEVEGLDFAPKSCPFCSRTKSAWIKAETFGIEALNRVVEKMNRQKLSKQKEKKHE